MIQIICYLLVFLGSALMVYNVYSFVLFTRSVKERNTWIGGNYLLYVPVALLTSFLLGYLGVLFFTTPGPLIAGILFGGSIYCLAMNQMLSSIVSRIAESEHLEAKLLATEENTRSKNSFLASIGHEMRTPLNIIQGMSALELKKQDLSEDSRIRLEKVSQSANLLAMLFDSVLGLQGAGDGEVLIRREAFSLTDSLRQISLIVSTLCEGKGLTYREQIGEGAFGEFCGDEMQLRRIFLALLDNAVKYTDPPGEVKFYVTWEKKERDHEKDFSFASAPSGENADTNLEGEAGILTVTVSDTGVGIENSFLEKIFEPFSQEDNSFTNRFGGAGLGLAVSRKIVEYMGGSLRAESEKGVGSTFILQVPLERLPEKIEEEVPPDLAGRRVLIVEDIADNAEILADILELEDVSSDWAENGKVAVERVAKEPPHTYDAILMDLRMPVMDGLEATRRIRSLGREDLVSIPIIAISANNSDIDIQNSLKAGMDQHLPKPFDPNRLYAVLDYWIKESTLRENVRK